jgi:hypothetical protein
MELIRVVWWFLGRRLRKSGYRPFLVNALGALFGFFAFLWLISSILHCIGFKRAGGRVEQSREGFRIFVESKKISKECWERRAVEVVF